MVLWCLPRQVSEGRGHAPQELLARVLVEQQLVVRLLRRGLWRVPLEELLVLQLVVLLLAVLLLVAAGSAD